jgi:hypothetical protein
VRETSTVNGIGPGEHRGQELVGQRQYVPVLHGPLRVINGPDLVLTAPGIGSTVYRYKSIIYTVDQVHPRGRKGKLDDDHDQAHRGALRGAQDILR